MKKLIIILLGLFWVLFGTGCQGSALGHLEFGFRAANEFVLFSRASEGGANSEMKSTLVDNVVDALKPDGVGPPAPEPEGP